MTQGQFSGQPIIKKVRSFFLTSGKEIYQSGLANMQPDGVGPLISGENGGNLRKSGG
jgi:hypothetical protein